MNWVRLGPGLLMPENNREASSAEKTDHKNIDLKTWACRALGVPGLVCASVDLPPTLRQVPVKPQDSVLAHSCLLRLPLSFC